MELEHLRQQAEKIVNLSSHMNTAFPYGNDAEHLLLCIMAGLQDAYVSGMTSKTTKTKP